MSLGLRQSIVTPQAAATAREPNLLEGLNIWHSMDETSDGSSAVTRADSHTSDGSEDLTDTTNTSTFIQSTSGLVSNAAHFAAGNGQVFTHPGGATDWNIYQDQFTIALIIQIPNAHPVGDKTRIVWYHPLIINWINQGGSPRLAIRTNSDGTFDFLVGDIVYGAWNFIFIDHDFANGELRVQLNDNVPESVAITSNYEDGGQSVEIGGGSDDTVDRYFDEMAWWLGRNLTSDEKDEFYNSGSGVAYSSL